MKYSHSHYIVGHIVNIPGIIKTVAAMPPAGFFGGIDGGYS
jgi:hypothetical protein